MPPTSLVIAPDGALEPLTLVLRNKLDGLASALTAENLASALGEQGLRMLGRLGGGRAGGEVILWGKSANVCLAAWTSREPEEEVTLAASADADHGLVAHITQVFNTERVALRAVPELRAADWTNLEARRGGSLVWMAASAIVVFERCVAVVTVQEWQGAQIASPSVDEVDAFSEAAELAGRLIEDNLIRATLGLEAS